MARACEEHPGSVLVFERLRKIKNKGASKSRRLNRKQANLLRGQINRLAKEKAYAGGTVTVEVNPHGTSQYCSRCGARGERFSFQQGRRVKGRGGKLFWCPACQYEVQADFNASANLHHSFYREFRLSAAPEAERLTRTLALPRYRRGGRSLKDGTPRRRLAGQARRQMSLHARWEGWRWSKEVTLQTGALRGHDLD